MGEKAKFMQYMISHGCVTAGDLFTFLGTLRTNERSQISEESVGKAVDSINGSIKAFNMMIRSAYDTNTRQRYYALISTVDNDITRQASHYTEKEFEYFRLVWQELQDGSAELNDLWKFGRDLKLPNFKDLIEEWHDKYWLYVDNGMVSLGVRANLELDVLRAAVPSTSASVSQPATRRGRIVEDDDDDEDSS